MSLALLATPQAGPSGLSRARWSRRVDGHWPSTRGNRKPVPPGPLRAARPEPWRPGGEDIADLRSGAAVRARAGPAMPQRREKAGTGRPKDPAGPPPDGGPDAGLVLRARAGDAQAFRALVERYQERVFWVARGMVGNDEDARDIAQEAFIRVHRSLDRFDVQLKLYTWLYQIAVNLCIDFLRRQGRRRGVSIDALGEVAGGDGGGDGGAQLEGQELRSRVQRVLDELPPKYKAVMVLSDLEGIGAKEIAAMTGTTHATVRWRHHRARRLFREAWERVFGRGSHVL